MKFAIATFCYGDRYYEQVNRFISSFDSLDYKVNLFVVTDNEDKILKRDFVSVKNIRDYNEKYLNYNKDYYSFDFSVKRYSVQFAFENGYNNVILSDADAVVNESLFTENTLKQCFSVNTISGPVTYDFKNQINTGSMLGRRFVHYEQKYNVEFDKELLDTMPEDCVQYISIEDDKKNSFLKTWDECVEIKYGDKLHNIPAGNIDEMCFAALLNGIHLKNNSSVSVNVLINKHDKWY